MRRTKKLDSHNQKTAYLFILPSMIILTLFVFIPLIAAFVISFTDLSLYMTGFTFAGFSNYKHLFTDSRVLNATKNTAIFTVIEVPIQIFVALVLTMFMLQNRRIHRFLRASFYIPYVCSMTAISILWSMLLNPNTGIVSYWLGKIGVTMPSIQTNAVFAMGVVILVTVWRNFGYTLTILTAAALDVSPSVYEAADLDGVGGLRRFLYITIPSIKSTIWFCLITTFILSFQAFDQIYMLTGGGPQYKTETLVAYIYDRGFVTGHDLGYASAISVYLFVIIAILSIFIFRFSRRGNEQ